MYTIFIKIVSLKLYNEFLSIKFLSCKHQEVKTLFMFDFVDLNYSRTDYKLTYIWFSLQNFKHEICDFIRIYITVFIIAYAEIKIVEKCSFSNIRTDTSYFYLFSYIFEQREQKCAQSCFACTINTWKTTESQSFNWSDTDYMRAISFQIF